MTYVYIQSEPGLLTVGFYDPSGKWHADSDYTTREEAAAKCAYLNGFMPPYMHELIGTARAVAAQMRRISFTVMGSTGRDIEALAGTLAEAVARVSP